MMKDSPTTKFLPRQENSIKATSTFRSAFSDPFNWLMILASAIFLVIGGLATLGKYGSWLPNFIALIVLLFGRFMAWQPGYWGWVVWGRLVA